MKYVLVVWLLLGAALTYIRYEKPADWNRFLDTMKVQGASLPVADASASADTNAPADDNAVSAPPARPSAPELISPSSTNFINPDHVKEVVQPTQPTTSSTATNTGATNSPSPATAPTP